MSPHGTFGGSVEESGSEWNCREFQGGTQLQERERSLEKSGESEVQMLHDHQHDNWLGCEMVEWSVSRTDLDGYECDGDGWEWEGSPGMIRSGVGRRGLVK